MSSDDFAIRVQGLSKYYQIYDAPKDRLKQMLVPRLQRMIGIQPKQYFREFKALNDVSFEIKKGETVGIIGRNGSGKSTLLQMICGTLFPTSGSVQTNGRIAALLELGSGFNPEFTGRENVYMNAAVLGLSREEIDTKFDDIVTFADIGEFIELPVKTYSSGMAVRLAFSVVAHINPDILVVDEALAVGDYLFQQKCFKRIDELQAKGCSILLVSHDLSAIVQFCSKGYVFEDGQLVEGGSAAEAVNIYKKLSTGTGLEADRSNSREMEPTSRLKDNFPINPAVQDYGTKVAEIYDWGILDEFGNTTTVISSESPTKIILRIRFLQSCTNPIVGYFFTDVQGREIVGTNTLFSKSPLSSRSSGECLEVTFKQSLLLTSGEYSLNLGCSEYRNDELVSHHRLYDVCMFSVLQLHQNVGFYLPPTDVEINELV